MRNIAILGSTGSIGTQALEVVRTHPGRFRVTVLTAHQNVSLLVHQALEFRPAKVVITANEKLAEVRAALAGKGIEVLGGEAALEEVASFDESDIVLTALVGFCGLKPTLAAIRAGKDIALANKETMVVAGDLVTALARKHQVKILPVDSEHSAIFQCLAGEKMNPVEKIFLTASGGPFLGKDRHFLSEVTAKEALRHPNWVMGAKISIDSATLMNKGLEVIEAKWLFDLALSQIDVVIHPQSVIHSMVQFTDGSIKAQMGLPDMKLPIQYALTYPQRVPNNFPRFSFLQYPELTFGRPDRTAFPNLDLAYAAIEKGGNMPCVINAANEEVVAAFLKGRLGFLQMSEVIGSCMEQVRFIPDPSLEDYLQTDQEARRMAAERVTKMTLNYQS